MLTFKIDYIVSNGDVPELPKPQNLWGIGGHQGYTVNFPSGFVILKAKDEADACTIFNKRHPNGHITKMEEQ